MDYGSGLRPPPRRRFAQRIAVWFCIALLALALGSGRAEAYPCGVAAARAADDCRGVTEREERPKSGDANLLSVAIFAGVIVAVLLVPLNYARRSDTAGE